MLYQRITLSTSTAVGNPGPLPYVIENWTPDLVADLNGLDPSLQLEDTGFWPVVDDKPAFDPATQLLVAGPPTVDVDNKRVVYTWTVADRLDVPQAPGLPNLTMRQFRLGLLHAGLLDGVNAAIDALPEPGRSVAKIEFEYAGQVVRTDPWVKTLAGAMGMTDDQVDSLWEVALAL